MNSQKPFMLDIKPSYKGLWSGQYPAHERQDEDGIRMVTVEFMDECELATASLAAEIAQVTTKEVDSATMVASCSRLVLQLHPGCNKPAKKVLRGWLDELESHLHDLPPDRHDALTRTTWSNPARLESESTSEERLANAMATSSPIGFNMRGR